MALAVVTLGVCGGAVPLAGPGPEAPPQGYNVFLGMPSLARCSLCSGDGVRVCAGQVGALETPFASRNSFSKVALTGQCRTRTATRRGSKASVHTTNRQ
jgi:hypothetical protein